MTHITHRSFRNQRARLAAAIEPLERRLLLTSVVVNTTADSTDAPGSTVVSLRDAVNIANNSTTATTITFSPTAFATAKTITLGGNDLEINGKQPVVLTGPAAGVTVNGNMASGDFVIDQGATVTITGLTITGGNGGDNSGGGIDNQGSLALNNVTVNGNVSQDNGDGINNTGTVTLADCTLSGNSGGFTGAGGGIDNTGTATLTDCTVSGNTPGAAGTKGGGIENDGTLSLTDVTISNNSSYSGAGLTNDGRATVIDCTIVGNSDTGIGAAIQSSTNPVFAETTVGNTIIAGNRNEADVGGDFTSLGGNLVGNTGFSPGFSASDKTGTSSSPLGPKLTPLGNFGGPTQTYVPLAGSPALGGGVVATVPAGVTTDQRGAARVVNGKVDIGAVEVQAAPSIVVQPPNQQSVVSGTTLLVSLGSISDPQGKGPFTVDVDWGDGTPDALFTQSAAGPITAQSHRFAKGGVIAGTIAVTDASGDLSNLASFSVSTTPVAPATFVVNTVKDQTDAPGSKTVSLRDAVADADQGYGPVTISFDPTVFAAAQTIELDNGGLELSNLFGLISVVGPAAGVTIVGAGLTVDSGVTASLSGFSISGSGIDNSGILTVSNSNISDAGSGIHNTGTLVLQDSSLSGNSSSRGGGLYNSGVATVANCAFFGNAFYSPPSVPGIVIAGAPDGEIRPDLGGNATGYGGAIENTGTLTLTNSTLSGNAELEGAAIYNTGTAVVSDCTISANNYGAAIQNGPTFGQATGTLTLANSIVAGNTAGDVVGPIKSLGHNLIGQIDSNSTGWVSSDLTGTDAHPLNPDLAPLANYAGATRTQPPLTGSAAIGAGSVALIPAGVTTDQRGFARIVGGKVDIGAVELQNASVVTVTPPAAQTVVAGKPASIELGSFTDPGGKGPFTVNVEWGDGSPESVFSVSTAGSLDAQTHTFAGAAAFAVTVIVSDTSGDVSSAAFSVFPSGAVISGTVFYDANGDGSQDNGETGLAGIRVYADLRNFGFFVTGDPSTTTNATGGYTLSGLAAGNYIVRQVASSNFAQTAPANGLGHHVTVSLGQTLSGQNFGDKSTAVQPAAISGTVFNDANGDGTQDNGETGLAGVQVYADLGNVGYFVTGDPTTITNATGEYTLPGLAAGDYIIRQASPSGYAQTTPTGGLGRHVTVSAGQTLAGQNFGDTATTAPTAATITGTVFSDANGDGTQDNGETGLAGVQVYLDLGNVGFFVTGDPTTTTNATGGYTLSGLAAVNYIVRQVLPPGNAQTAPSGGLGRHVTVSTGQTLAGQNFGDKSSVAPAAAITGTIFNDANSDGAQDNGETGLAGVQVYLDLGNVGFFVTGDPTTMTNANGGYTLSGLAAGNYIVRQALPLGYVQTTPGSGFGHHVAVSAGQTLSGQNFGDKA